MGQLLDSRLVWFAGLILLIVLVRCSLRRLGPRPLEIIDIRIVRQESAPLSLEELSRAKTGDEFTQLWVRMSQESAPPSPEELRLREEIRSATAALGLGRATSIRNAKTGDEFMDVWLYVPKAEAVAAKVEESLSAYPVKVTILRPPLDPSGAAITRRGIPAIWKALVNSWRETRRSRDG